VPAVTVANRIVVERNLAQRIERQDVNQSRNWLACMVAAKVWSASRSSCRLLDAVLGLASGAGDVLVKGRNRWWHPGRGWSRSGGIG
jgi:hypothetical protein